MLFHPPILYLGYVGFTVPFAFAIAALITGRVGEGWLVATRRWALFAWGFLTVGILLGGWWSYEVLGWGGVWGWDPVENASFLPWLTGTAYIHSVLVQERRGMLRVWNISLLVATFSLTILGTFLTRSGVMNSVHAFSNGTIGPYLLGFFGVIVAVSLGLIAWRGDRLRSPGAIDSPISREGAFLANNVIFTVFAFVVLLGTVFPLIVEALQDRQIAVGPPFFDRLSMPIGITLLFLMAVAPVLPWRKASTELLRDRLFWPAWCGVGDAGDQRDRRAPTDLRRCSRSASAGSPPVRRCASSCSPPAARAGAVSSGGPTAGWSCTSASSSSPWRWRPRTATRVSANSHCSLPCRVVRRAYVRAREVAAVHRRALDRREGADQDRRRTDVRAGDHDVHQLRHQDPDAERAQPACQRHLPDARTERRGSTATEAPVKIFIKPMIVWLWIGGVMMAVGTVLAAFPGRRRRGRPIRCRRPSRWSRPVSEPVVDRARVEHRRRAATRAAGSRPFIVARRGRRVAALFVVLASGKAEKPDVTSSFLLGRPAPAVASTTLDGKPFDLSRRKGSWVVLNFFQSTCVPCKAEHPELVRVRRAAGDHRRRRRAVHRRSRTTPTRPSPSGSPSTAATGRSSTTTTARSPRRSAWRRCPRRGSSTRPASS